MDVQVLKQVFTEVLQEHLEPIKQEIVVIQKKQDAMEGKLDSVWEQTGRLTEYHTETVKGLDRIEKKVDRLEKRDQVLDTLILRSVEQEGEIRLLRQNINMLIEEFPQQQV